MRIVYEVTERTMDKNGQFLILPDIECNTFWTKHGRRVILALGRSNIWREAFIDVYKRFALT